MESIDVVQQEEIEQRLRAGEKAMCIAREKGYLRAQVVMIARVAGIKLKKGRQKICDNPELYGKHIDEKFGSGTAENIKRWRERLTYDDIGFVLGGLGRGSAHHIGKYLTGRAPKPVVPHKPMKWQRVDITTDKVRESAGRCLSVAAMERELHASSNVIYSRARAGKITLPNGRLNRAEIMQDKRTDII